VLDSFHANVEEADPCAAARAHASRVGLVHLSDSNRRMPGDGHFPTAAWIAALREGGYSGEFAIEAEFGPDAAGDARRALAACRALGV
jgi:D-psicose/D-tagatose/L-ribulose 3-epimerase